ncbi:carboxypeptidase-like regulatory domain-containing protein [Streptomyces sp. AK08-01B]|nr:MULTISPECIES: carboxypeptidase-like regulatory domain-containing protein [unclassified Streptomyces]MDX2730248.1 carboxypeptidase-like regulatory domain-containing protein [Streptomyces sp. PA03-2a]MDX3768935.1 carboxypeptidase-like regulatory domain-containing protein [Streptomyces sp. AK08-01B]MDX3815661.1 carboxypeptidase-like regulatory domain-containing protein [Streptomyces sp. AK08-01A]
MTAGDNGHPATADTAPRTNGQIAGVVRAASPDRPLPGADISAVDATGEVVAHTTTDRDGRFRLTGLPHRLYALTRAPGPTAPPDGDTLHLTLDGMRS